MYIEHQNFVLIYVCVYTTLFNRSSRRREDIKKGENNAENFMLE